VDKASFPSVFFCYKQIKRELLGYLRFFVLINREDENYKEVQYMIVGVMKEKTKLTPNGIKILMVESFVKINPTDPLMLAKQVARRKRN
jgi:hypothetical protein